MAGGHKQVKERSYDYDNDSQGAFHMHPITELKIVSCALLMVN